MATYILKRKLYGMGSAISNTIGGTMEGVGNALDSKPAAWAGGLLGAGKLGKPLGESIKEVMPFGMGWAGNLAGYAAGAALGAAATRGLGKGMKSAGESLQQ